MAVTGFAGVLVYTAADRFAALRTFYVDVLALPVRTDRPGFVSFAWGTPPTDVRLTVTVHDQLTEPNRSPLHVMINLATDDITGDIARISATGATITRQPEREPWGGTVATVRDPDGNVVQLLQLPG